MLYAGCILCCARYRGDGRTYLVCCETRYFQPISCLSLLPWFYHYPCLFTEYGLNVRSVNSSINHNTINYAIPSLHLCFQYIYIYGFWIIYINTRDYGIDFDDDTHQVKAFTCRCKSQFCRDTSKKRKASKSAGSKNNRMTAHTAR